MSRTYRIEPDLAHDGFRRGFSFRTYRTWRLHLGGEGYWCVADDRVGDAYDSQETAERVGRIWVRTGLQPCEQTEERLIDAAGMMEAAE